MKLKIGKHIKILTALTLKLVQAYNAPTNLTQLCDLVEKFENNKFCRSQIICNENLTTQLIISGNCYDLQAYYTFWYPPKLEDCNRKYGNSQNINQCHDNLKQSIRKCWSSITKTFDFKRCSDLIAMSRELEELEYLNTDNWITVPNNKQIWNPKHPPCHSFLQEEKDYVIKSRPYQTGDNPKFDACLENYKSMNDYEDLCLEEVDDIESGYCQHYFELQKFMFEPFEFNPYQDLIDYRMKNLSERKTLKEKNKSKKKMKEQVSTCEKITAADKQIICENHFSQVADRKAACKNMAKSESKTCYTEVKLLAKSLFDKLGETVYYELYPKKKKKDKKTKPSKNKKQKLNICDLNKKSMAEREFVECQENYKELMDLSRICKSMRTDADYEQKCKQPMEALKKLLPAKSKSKPAKVQTKPIEEPCVCCTSEQKKKDPRCLPPLEDEFPTEPTKLPPNWYGTSSAEVVASGFLNFFLTKKQNLHFF